MEKSQIIFLAVSLFLLWMVVPHRLQNWERVWSCSRFCWEMVWSPHSFPRPWKVSLTSISSMAQGADPRQGLHWITWSYKCSCFHIQHGWSEQILSRGLCFQVSAQSSAWPLGKSFIPCKLLSQGKKRLCAPGLSPVLSITASCSIESCFQTIL